MEQNADLRYSIKRNNGGEIHIELMNAVSKLGANPALNEKDKQYY